MMMVYLTQTLSRYIKNQNWEEILIIQSIASKN